MSPFLLPAVFALGLLGFARDAAAYCRSTTCRSTPAKECETDADGCPAEGAKLFWATSCISYATNRLGTQDLDPAGFGEDAASLVGPIGNVRLAQRRVELPRSDRAHVLDGALGRLGDGDQTGDAAAASAPAGARAGRVADRAGDEAADREVGTAGRPRPNPEEADFLRAPRGDPEAEPRQGGQACAAEESKATAPAEQASRKPLAGLNHGAKLLRIKARYSEFWPGPHFIALPRIMAKI